MCHFSIEIMNVIQNVDSVNTLKCVYNNIMECHHIKQFWLVVTEWMKVITATLGITIAGIFPVITRCFVIPWALRPRWYLMFVIVLFLLSVIPDSITVMYHVYFSGSLLQGRIALGEWNAIFCCLNAVGRCSRLLPMTTDPSDQKCFPRSALPNYDQSNTDTQT